MGQVYLAEQISLKRKVALKLLRADLASNPTALQRFNAEAQAVARATHANIVQVYATDEVNGLHYIALEYVEGRNLREYVEKKGPPELLVALSIMRQVASALQRAGELGIIHRDIKPENILLTRKGEAKVADFGLSRCFADDRQALNLTQSGVAMGTPMYMSPEQVEGRPVDPRTDIYSFGVTCFFMFAGQPPFHADTAFGLALCHVQTPPPPLGEIRPDLPPSVCALVHKMMAKRPEERYQTGREIVREVAQLRDALVGLKSGAASRLMTTTPVPADMAGLPVVQAASASRHWPRWLGVACVLLGVLGGAWIGWLRSPTPAAATASDKSPDQLPVPDPVVPPPHEREQLLRREWARYADPGVDPERTRWGLRYAVELGLLFLSDERLDDAEKWFREVEDTGNHQAYRLLGKMGRAIVLAFRDRYKESNFLFESITPTGLSRAKLSDTERRWLAFLVIDNRQFRRTIARALDHNFDNNSPEFPRSLERLRHPPNPDPQRGR
jgi:serine/threonine-protein kinase